jgi:protein involved in polysaccharide export with SLBB domain
VYGAVNKPKFVKMAPVSRFHEAINGAGGLQKYADTERSVLIRNGNSKNIFLKEFLLKGDLNNNPQLLDGDKIYVPFLNITPDKQADYMEYDNSNKVLVTGFVFRPGTHYFRPGFSVKDYIALSGGTLDVGAANRVKILKKDGTTILAYNKVVEPGDIIEIPETYGSIFFGNTGFIQALTSIATLILAYQATQQ